MEDDCEIKSLDELITIPEEDKPKVKDTSWKSEKINGKYASEFNYTWNEGKASGIMSLEQIAYLKWYDAIWMQPSADKEQGKIKYNVLLKAANKYSDDLMSEIVYKINATRQYKDCRYTGPTR